ncbi:MAG: hypothetical protein U1D55_04080 [Phycisphaerae bacterium]
MPESNARMTSTSIEKRTELAILGVFGGAGAATAVSAWLYAGPYRWMVEAQLFLSGGSYSPKLAFTLAYVLVLVVVIAIALYGGRLLPARRNSGGWITAADVSDEDPSDEPVETDAALAPQDLARTSWTSGDTPLPGSQSLAVVSLTVFGIVLGIGSVLWWHGASLGALTQMSVAELEGGKTPTSGYLTLEGHALWDCAVCITSNGSKTYYSPLVSDDWEPPQPVAVYLVSGHQPWRSRFDRSVATYIGTRSLEGIPGPVRAEFDQSDFKPAAQALILSLDDKPDGYIASGQVVTPIGALGTAGGAIWLLVARRRAASPSRDASADRLTVSRNRCAGE